ncbi:MAG: carboxymuconolactone decarboxylase family protein [Bacteroidetes bacterium]|nr:carboxymuconolactone decarboxylase family protein [Bacteroidota bacterium]
MPNRFSMKHTAPNAYKAMGALDDYIEKSNVPALHQELIRIRASQINGCAYCVHMHTSDARKLGERDERMLLINVWREAKNIFSEEEQLLLSVTEEITLVHQHGLGDDNYNKAITMWGKEKTAEIIMTIIGINAWNRIGVSLKMEPVIEG